MSNIYIFTLKNLIIILIILQHISLHAQSNENMTLLSQWNENPTNDAYYNDLWGYVDDDNNEYAIIGSLSDINIINISAIHQPVLVDKFEFGGSSSSRDFKTYDRYVYMVAGTGSEGLQILDMSALPSGSILNVYKNNTFFSSCKNIFIDHTNARLYAAGTNTRNDGLIIFDISSPTLPTVLASVSLSGGTVENLFVKDNIAYCSHGDAGIKVYDLNTPSTPNVLAYADTGGHNKACWLSETGKFLVYANDFPAGQPLGLVYTDEVGDDALPILSTFHAPLLAPTHTDNVPANIYMIGDYVFVAYYEDGVVIFDVSNFSNPTRIAHFDTQANTSYNGAIGCSEVYPFLPSGNLLALDIQTGLHVFFTDIQINTTCDNGYQDANELGADCGGYCAPCAMPTCEDGIQNGNETGIDCGGFCLPCDLPTCEDGIQNGEETDIDCGGFCPPCCPPEGAPCDDGNPETENDTADGFCNCIGMSIIIYSCFDNIQNSDEVGIDCGGNFCPPCAVCESYAVNSTYEYIDKIIINNIHNVSGNDGGYGDYTHLLIALEPDVAYPISLFTAYAGANSVEYWQVWIDLDFDGDFDDVGELVFEKNGAGSVAGEITVPQPQGGNFPIMRVQMQYNQYTNDACKDFYYGEVEDYQLFITGNNMSCDDGIQNGGETGVDCGGLICEPCCPLPGTACDDANPNTQNDVEDGNCNCAGTACPPAGTPCDDGNPNTPNDLTDNQCNCNGTACPPAGAPCDDGNPNTENDAADGLCGCAGRLISACADGIQNGTETGVDCGGDCQPCFYCDSQGNNSSLEYIKNVVFNEINNPTDNDGGYANYTNLSAQVSPGMTYQIHLTPGFPNEQLYQEYWRVWIDYTQDGDFLDMGEMVYQGSGNSMVTGNISIPILALVGQTRMRVQVNLNGYTSTGCDIYARGEVEDYTLIINGENNFKINNINVKNIQIIPNPFRERVTLSYEIVGDMPNKGTVYLYDIWGRKVIAQEFVTQQNGQLSYELNHLPSGSYMMQLVIGDYVSIHKILHE